MQIMNCECNENQFVSLFFFQNGAACKPEKLRVRRNEIEKFISKEGKFYFYHGKALYTLTGGQVCSLANLPENSAYVLSIPYDTFIPCKYSETFEKICSAIEARKRKLELSRGTRSVPAIPSKGLENFTKNCDKMVSIRQTISERSPSVQSTRCLKSQSNQSSKSCGRQKLSKCESGNTSMESGNELACSKHSLLSKARSAQQNPSTCSKNSNPRVSRCGCGKPPSNCGCNKSPSVPSAKSQNTCDNWSQKSTNQCQKNVTQKRCDAEPKRERIRYVKQGMPCCDEDDENDEDSCPELNVPRKSARNYNEHQHKPCCPPKKKGFLATCCPCCVKKVKSTEARPVTAGTDPCSKLTQTSKEDFKESKKRLKDSIKAEKKRRNMYGKSRAPRRPRTCCKPQYQVNEECDDEKAMKERRKYIKTREKFQKRRNQREEQLKKSLVKQYGYACPGRKIVDDGCD